MASDEGAAGIVEREQEVLRALLDARDARIASLTEECDELRAVALRWQDEAAERTDERDRARATINGMAKKNAELWQRCAQAAAVLQGATPVWREDDHGAERL